MSTSDVLQALAERVSQQLRTGEIPWRGRRVPAGADGKPMTALNRAMLASRAGDDGRFLHISQIEKQGGKLDAGAPQATVAHVVRVAGADGKVTPELRAYTVYAAADVAGLKPMQTRPDFAGGGTDIVEKMLKASGSKIERSDKAAYVYSTDTIILPDRREVGDFRWRADALRMMAHATARPERLNRWERKLDEVRADGRAVSRTREELRADIAASFAAADLGIAYAGHRDDATAFRSLIDREPGEFARAAADAEKMHRVLLSYSQIKQEIQEPAPQDEPIKQRVEVKPEQIEEVLNFAANGEWAEKRFKAASDERLEETLRVATADHAAVDPEVRMQRVLAQFEASRRGLEGGDEAPLYAIIEKNLGHALENPRDQDPEVRITRWLANSAGHHVALKPGVAEVMAEAPKPKATARIVHSMEDLARAWEQAVPVDRMTCQTHDINHRLVDPRHVRQTPDGTLVFAHRGKGAEAVQGLEFRTAAGKHTFVGRCPAADFDLAVLRESRDAIAAKEEASLGEPQAQPHKRNMRH